MQGTEITPEHVDKVTELFNKFFEMGYEAQKKGIPLELGKTINAGLIKYQVQNLMKDKGDKNE